MPEPSYDTVPAVGLEALVFDFDGLIVDTEMPQYLTVKAEFEAHGLELDLDRWLAIIGGADHPHWLDQLEAAVGAPIEREVVFARKMAAHRELILRTEVRPGVVEVIDQADRLGIPAAVASSSPRDWVTEQLERVDLLGRFVLTRTREDVERAKPWPDVYLRATEALGANPARSVAFEDSRNGSLAAVAAGLFTVVVPNELTRHQDLSHAHLAVDSLVGVSLDDLRGRVTQ